MGIDYESRLIIGYEISYDKLFKYLIDNKAGSCHYYGKKEDGTSYSSSQPCNCGTMCWNKKSLMSEDSTFSVPEGVHIICASPYYDCPYENCNYYISLTDKTKLNAEEIKNILNNEELINNAKEFYNSITSATADNFIIMSTSHIY